MTRRLTVFSPQATQHSRAVCSANRHQSVCPLRRRYEAFTALVLLYPPIPAWLCGCVWGRVDPVPVGTWPIGAGSGESVPNHFETYHYQFFKCPRVDSRDASFSARGRIAAYYPIYRPQKII